MKIEKVKYDLDIVGESALARAQSCIQNALDHQNANITHRARVHLLQMLDGGYNLTVKEFAKALALCGYEVKFELEKKGTIAS